MKQQLLRNRKEKKMVNCVEGCNKNLPSNPIDRFTAISLNSYSFFRTNIVRDNIITGLSEIKDFHSKYCFIVGGYKNGCKGIEKHIFVYYYDGEYKITHQDTSQVITVDTAGEVYSFLDKYWNSNSYLYTGLVHKKEVSCFPDTVI